MRQWLGLAFLAISTNENDYNNWKKQSLAAQGVPEDQAANAFPYSGFSAMQNYMTPKQVKENLMSRIMLGAGTMRNFALMYAVGQLEGKMKGPEGAFQSYELIKEYGLRIHAYGGPDGKNGYEYGVPVAKWNELTKGVMEDPDFKEFISRSTPEQLQRMGNPGRDEYRSLMNYENVVREFRDAQEKKKQDQPEEPKEQKKNSVQLL